MVMTMRTHLPRRSPGLFGLWSCTASLLLLLISWALTIFIDEIDAIAPPRKDGVEELSKRLVGTLLELMDGIGINGGLVVIAATNRPDHIDPTLRQGGRFDKDIEIGRRSASLGDSMDLAILGY
ncbi:hypothetical protein P8452_39680 [Trifolium repens]|nr:hypothetical protein P8452_39680 [Trifolium repens]